MVIFHAVFEKKKEWMESVKSTQVKPGSKADMTSAKVIFDVTWKVV